MITPLVHLTVRDESTSKCVWTINVVLQKDDIMYEVGYVQDRYGYYEIERSRLTCITLPVIGSGGVQWYFNLLEKIANDTPRASNLKAIVQDRDQYVTVPQAVEILSKWYMIHTL